MADTPTSETKHAEVARRSGQRAARVSPARRVGSFLAEMPVLLLVAFVLALLLRSFLVQAFYIPSESMMPTLEIGDRVLVNRLAYRWGDPARGQIVVFSDEAGAERTAANPLASGLRSLAAGLGLAPPSEEDFIKRVVGLPGETIEIRSGVVYIDGQEVPEATTPDGGYLSERDSSFLPPMEIPADEYFVMGDNRPRSSDSRSLLGTIGREQLIGRAFVLVWPFNRAEVLSAPDYAVVASSSAVVGALRSASSSAVVGALRSASSSAVVGALP